MSQDLTMIRLVVAARLRHAVDDLNASEGDDERAAGMADAFSEVLRMIDEFPS